MELGFIVGAPMAVLAGFLGFMSTAFSVGSKTLSKKITKHEKKNYFNSRDKTPVS